MSYKSCKFCCDRSKIKCTLFEEHCVPWSASRLPLEGFYWKFISCIPYAWATNSEGWCPLVTNWGHFTWKTKYVFVCTSASMGAIFLKVHPSHYPGMRYKHFEFRCNQSLIKGTLTGEQCTSSPLSLLPFGEVSWKFMSCIPHACASKFARLVVIGKHLRALY
jgi:hypothetical protein